MEKIDLEKFICDLHKDGMLNDGWVSVGNINYALKEQGLKVDDGEIVKIPVEYNSAAHTSEGNTTCTSKVVPCTYTNIKPGDFIRYISDSTDVTRIVDILHDGTWVVENRYSGDSTYTIPKEDQDDWIPYSNNEIERIDVDAMVDAWYNKRTAYYTNVKEAYRQGILDAVKVFNNF